MAWGNDITDISPLAGLTKLKELRLRGNKIRDVSPLRSLTKLKELRIKQNLLNASSIKDRIPALQARGVAVEFDPTPVTIPDANLRAVIAAKLGKASGATITVADMITLTSLDGKRAGISDLTGLEFATSLAQLELYGNGISDISALADLTNLTLLYLSLASVSDISALADLTNLTNLGLEGSNNLSDISPIAGLTNLKDLNLGGNNLTDISPLRNSTRLTTLDLSFNNLTDISPLTPLRGLDSGGEWTGVWTVSVYLKGNPLSASSLNDHIPTLERNDVTVHFDPPFRESDFDIELVFLDDHSTEKRQRIFRYAARRWMSIIREDLPDYTPTQGWSFTCGDQSYEIPPGERIDDLRIYVGSVQRMGEVRTHVANEEITYTPAAFAGPNLSRETGLPILGCVGVGSFAFDYIIPRDLLDLSLHEIGHILGIGTTTDYLQDFSNDPHFNGPLAIAAFNDAGGRDYAGAKVPMEKSGGHWRSPVLGDELMGSSGTRVLSAITIQALADLGWVVDVTQADPYGLFGAAAKASAKIAASSIRAEPQWTCGVGQQREPIYVVDPQGRVVRTLHR